MIIPIKCFTCGKVLADKYVYYIKTVNQNKIENNDEVMYLKHDNIKKTIEGQTLDHLGLTKMCCRRHMLTHVDIE